MFTTIINLTQSAATRKMSMLAALLCGVFVLPLYLAFAQEATETPAIPTETEEMVTIATVNVYSAVSTPRENGLYQVDFDIHNRVGIQPDIRYGVELRDEAQKLVDVLIAPEILSLGENQQVHRTVEYTPPAHLSGTYHLWVKSENSSGLPLGLQDLGPITLTGTDQALVVQAEDCVLKIPGSIPDRAYEANYGVDVNAGEILVLSCPVSNGLDQELQLYPVFSTYERTLFGMNVGEEKATDPVTIPNGTTTQLEVIVPTMVDPQAYVAQFHLANEAGEKSSNSFTFRYVIHGESGTIQNLTLDKAAYAAGETAIAKVFWSPSADNFENARLGGSSLPEAEVAFMVKVMSGEVVCAEHTESFAESLDGTELVRDISIPITVDCPTPVVDVKLADARGGLLDEKFYSYEVPVQVSAESDGGSVAKLVVLILLTLILIAGTAFFIWKKRNTLPPLPTMLFAFLILTASFFGQAPQAAADTLAISNGTVTANLNKPAYVIGENVSLTVSASTFFCWNDHDALTVTSQHNSAGPVSELINTYISYNYQAYCSAGQEGPYIPFASDNLEEKSFSSCTQNPSFEHVAIWPFQHNPSCGNKSQIYCKVVNAEDTYTTYNVQIGPVLTYVGTQCISERCNQGWAGGASYSAARISASADYGLVNVIAQQHGFNAKTAIADLRYTLPAASSAPAPAPAPAPVPSGSCGPTSVSWGSGCTGNTPVLANGESTGVSNIATDYDGIATYNCSNGSLIRDIGGYCNHIPSLPSWNLNAGNCRIPIGSSTCPALVTWSSENIGGISLRQNDTQFSTAANSPVGGVNRYIPHGNTLFSFYSWGTYVDSDFAYASCNTGSIWSASAGRCVGVTPTATINSTDCVIPVGRAYCTAFANWDSSNVTGPRVSVKVGSAPSQILSTQPTGSSQRMISVGAPGVFTFSTNGVAIASNISYASCITGSTWNPTAFLCVATAAPTANLNVNDCDIRLNESTCPVTVTWSSSGVVGASVRKDDDQFSIELNNSSGVVHQLSYNGGLPYTFTFHNAASPNPALVTQTARGKCVSGSSWNGSVCASTVSAATTASVDDASCKIQANQSSCNATITWTAANVITPELRLDNTQISTSITGPETESIAFGTHTLAFYDRSYSTSIPLETATAEATCDDGTNWNGTVCVIAPPEIDLSVGTCKIAVGDSSCQTTIDWEFKNLAGPYNVENDLTNYTSGLVSSGGAIAHTLDYGINTITAAANGISATEIREVDCVDNSAWYNGVCVPPPSITLSVDPDLIRSGDFAEVSLQVDAAYPFKCTLYGGNLTPIDFDSAAGTYTNTFTTRNLTATQVVQLNCTDDLGWGITSSDNDRVNVIPVIQEN